MAISVELSHRFRRKTNRGGMRGRDAVTDLIAMLNVWALAIGEKSHGRLAGQSEADRAFKRSHRRGGFKTRRETLFSIPAGEEACPRTGE